MCKYYKVNKRCNSYWPVLLIKAPASTTDCLILKNKEILRNKVHQRTVAAEHREPQEFNRTQKLISTTLIYVLENDDTFSEIPQ